MKKEQEDEKDLTEVDYGVGIFKKISTYGLFLTLIFYGFGSVISFLTPMDKVKENIQIPCINSDYKISYSFPLGIVFSPLNLESCLPILKPVPLAPLKISFRGLKGLLKLNFGLDYFLLGKAWKNSFYIGLSEQEFIVKEGSLDFSEISDYVRLPLEMEGLMNLGFRLFLKDKQLQDFNVNLSSKNFVIQQQVIVSDQFGNMEIPLFDFKKAEIDLIYANKVLLFKKFQLGEDTLKLSVEGTIKGDLKSLENAILDLQINFNVDPELKEKLEFLSLLAPEAQKENGFSLKIQGSISSPSFE